MPKKRSPGEGGLYFVASRGLWRGVVDVGYHPDGRRKQKYVTAKTQAEARRKLRALQDEIAKYGAPLDKNVTVEQWADHWLETVCRPKMKPEPFGGYKGMVRKWIIPTIGRKRLALLKPSDLRLVYKAIDDAGLRSTAAKAHTVMSSMLESARLDGAIPRNVAADVVPPTEGNHERGAFSTEDALHILSTAAHHVDGTRWWVALLAGMRQGERCGATLDSINLRDHTFTVQWSLTEATFEHGCVKGDAKLSGNYPCGRVKGGYCPDRRMILARNLEHRPLDGSLILVRPKSGKPRTFPLIPQLESAIVRYLDATRDTPNPHGLIWRNPDGSPIRSPEDQDAWRGILHEAGLITAEQAKRPKDRAEGTPEIPTTHWARHTTATVLMELRVDPKVIGEIVGHANARTTAGYQHVSSELAREAMEAIGGRFAKALDQ